MIVLKPTGGLCNRMRAINSAIAFAEQTGHQLKVVWEENIWLNCNYYKLFQENGAFSVISLKRHQNTLYNTSDASVYRFPRRQYHWVMNRLMFSKTYFDNQGTSSIAAMGLTVEAIKRYGNKKKIYISTGHAFFPSPYRYEHFVPTEGISGIVDGFINKLGNPPLGMHIRRTDHAPSIAESSDELFEQVVHTELASSPDATFFLATDSPESEQHFIKLFGEAVRVYPKAWGRNSEQGILDAAVDLYLLSRCSKIFASFQSSFSETASVIGDIPLQVVRKQSNPLNL
jgi:hypothetical protein